MISTAHRILISLAFTILTTSPAISAEPAAWTEWTDLLPKVNEKNRVEGTWQRVGKTLRAFAESPSNVPLPIELDGYSYDLQVEFVRNSGSGSVQIGLPVCSHYCTLALGGWNDAASTLASIDGQEPHPSATRRPGKLINGKAYTVLARVRLHGKSVAIEVLVDKEPYHAGGVEGASLSQSHPAPLAAA
jgi:hypothetical protein